MDETTFGRRFEGKVAIVTGASTNPGIGRSSARRLALEGASVVINARSEDQLRETERALKSEGLSVVAVAGSADDDDTPARLVDTALDQFGRIDLLANTVGGAPYPGSALDIDRAAFIDTVSMNTWPTLALIQEAVRRGLGDDGGGAIVNISSGSPKKTTPSMAAYAAAKAALNALTRTLANDLGPRGVRVNAVSPGLTRTMATQSMWEKDERRGGREPPSARSSDRGRRHRCRCGLPAVRRCPVGHRRAHRRRRREPRVVRGLVAVPSPARRQLR